LETNQNAGFVPFIITRNVVQRQGNEKTTLQEGILGTSTRGNPSIKSSLAKAASNETERVVAPKEDTHLS